jgi:hypothetical protein
MVKRGALTNILAILGMALVWFSILAPIFFSVVALVRRGRFLFDFLMPAEFFYFALIGGGLLAWGALRAQARVKLTGLSLVIACVLLVVSLGLAVVTGLASGETEPAGLWWGLVVAGILGYDLAVVSMGVGGVLLLRDLFKTHLS